MSNEDAEIRKLSVNGIECLPWVEAFEKFLVARSEYKTAVDRRDNDSGERYLAMMRQNYVRADRNLRTEFYRLERP